MHVSLYHDDTALYTSSYRIDTIVNRLEKSAKKITKIYENNRPRKY